MISMNLGCLDDPFIDVRKKPFEECAVGNITWFGGGECQNFLVGSSFIQWGSHRNLRSIHLSVTVEREEDDKQG